MQSYNFFFNLPPPFPPQCLNLLILDHEFFEWVGGEAIDAIGAIDAVVGFVCFICLGLGGLGDGGVRG